MKILHFSWEYPPVMYGGLGAHVLALTREQAKQGHDVVVVTQQSDDVETSPALELMDGVRVIRAVNADPELPLEQNTLDRWSHGFALGSFNAARLALPNWIPDIIHGHDWIAAEQSHLFSNVTGSPVVLTIHATEMGRHQGWLTSRISRIVNARELQAIRQADQVIVCSEFMKRELETSLFIQPNRVSVIPNGVNVTDFSINGYPIREVITQKNSNFIIGFLGRVEWEKGTHHVIDSLKFLPDAKFKVSVIGDGSQLVGLRQKVNRNGFQDRVKFHGKVTVEEKIRLLAACDVLVIPSSYEPFGIVALEAGAAHIPIIAASVGGLREIISDSRFGFLLEHVDGSEIAKLIREIEREPIAATQSSQELFDRINQHFTWPSIARSTELLYAQVLHASSHA
jgi:glycogen(starch) synthase